MKAQSRTFLIAAAVAAVLIPAQSQQARADEAPANAQSATAQAAVQAFGAALKGELMQAMQAGGPVNAIEVCNARAPAIAEAVSIEQDVDLYRVSLKPRNPENAPNGWQRDVLVGFEERKAAGEDPAGLTWQATVDTPGGREFRYMQAIPTAGLCLNCHGEALAPPVREKIAALYPDDQATGFSEGDIRGAFVVIEQF